jgi:hypothetical protein
VTHPRQYEPQREKVIHLKDKEKLLVLRAVGVAPLPTRCDELAGVEGGGRQEGGGGKVASKLHYKFIVACVLLSEFSRACNMGRISKSLCAFQIIGNLAFLVHLEKHRQRKEYTIYSSFCKN